MYSRKCKKKKSFSLLYTLLFFSDPTTITGVIPWASEHANNLTEWWQPKPSVENDYSLSFVLPLFHLYGSWVKRAWRVCVSDHLSSSLAKTMFLCPSITACSIAPVYLELCFHEEKTRRRKCPVQLEGPVAAWRSPSPLHTLSHNSANEGALFCYFWGRFEFSILSAWCVICTWKWNINVSSDLFLFKVSLTSFLELLVIDIPHFSLGLLHFSPQVAGEAEGPFMTL